VSSLYDGLAKCHFRLSTPYRLFFLDPMYVKLLNNITYFNLDEIGTQIKPANIINSGFHAIGYAQVKAARRRNFDLHCNRGKIRRDKAFLDQVDTAEWAGPVVWQNGRLLVLHGSADFPARRELMFFHRPEKIMDFYPGLVQSPQQLDQVFNDMITFGYLLPSWIPLASPMLMCRTAGDNRFTPTNKILRGYQPYAATCPAYTHEFDILPLSATVVSGSQFEQSIFPKIGTANTSSTSTEGQWIRGERRGKRRRKRRGDNTGSFEFE
jgi:hypothetical protein